MKSIRTLIVLVLLSLIGGTASATVITTPNGTELEVMMQGGTVSLDNRSVSDWWYGCSATTAGMMMGYYDRNGYNSQSYDNLVAGGVAEANVIGLTTTNTILKDIIASQGHQSDFYNAGPGGAYAYDTSGGSGNGYGESGDDNATSRASDCLADFMGTSQDSSSNTNGGTTFYNYLSNSKFTLAQMEAQDATTKNSSGMYGLKEYVEYCGYGVSQLYNQQADTTYSGGFSFTNYKSEIDSGRVVMLHFTGHTVFGYGYTDSNLLFHNTWDANEATVAWNGTYTSGSYSGSLKSVTVLELAGGGAGSGSPEPESILLMLLIIASFTAKHARQWRSVTR